MYSKHILKALKTKGSLVLALADSCYSPAGAGTGAGANTGCTTSIAAMSTLHPNFLVMMPDIAIDAAGGCRRWLKDPRSKIHGPDFTTWIVMTEHFTCSQFPPCMHTNMMRWYP